MTLLLKQVRDICGPDKTRWQRKNSASLLFWEQWPRHPGDTQQGFIEYLQGQPAGRGQKVANTACKYPPSPGTDTDYPPCPGVDMDYPPVLSVDTNLNYSPGPCADMGMNYSPSPGVDEGMNCSPGPGVDVGMNYSPVPCVDLDQNCSPTPACIPIWPTPERNWISGWICDEIKRSLLILQGSMEHASGIFGWLDALSMACTPWAVPSWTILCFCWNFLQSKVKMGRNGISHLPTNPAVFSCEMSETKRSLKTVSNA